MVMHQDILVIVDGMSKIYAYAHLLLTFAASESNAAYPLGI